MSTKKADISEIRKYLNGELDGHAMHRLERESQGDPFLMEALEGYGSAAKDSQAILDGLTERLNKRITQRESKIIPFKMPAIAAAVIVALSIGGFWLIKSNAPKRESLAMLKTEPKLAFRNDTIAAATPLQPQQTQSQITKNNSSASITAPNAGLTSPNDTSLKSTFKNDATDNIVAFNQPVVKQSTYGYLAPNSNQGTLAKADTLKKRYSYNIANKKDSTYVNKPLLAKVAGANVTPMDGNFNENKKAKIINGVVITDNDKAPTGLNTALVKTEHTNMPNALGEEVVAGYAGQRKKDVAGSNSVKANTIQSDDADVSSLVQGQAGMPVAAEKPVYVAPNRAVHTVTGRVFDRQNGEPLPGAVVKVRGTIAGVITDGNGYFILNNADDKSIVTISYIGYKSQVININGSDSLKVTLTQGTNSLAEVMTGRKANAVPCVNEAAHPNNGWPALKKYLEEKTVSPDGHKGTVKLTFIVSKNGSISDIKVVKGLSPATDQEAIKLITAGLGWVGNANGKSEKVTVKIKF